MKTIIPICALIVTLTVSCCSQRNEVYLELKDAIEHVPNDVSPDVLLISFDGENGKKNLLEAIEQFGATIRYDYDNMDLMAIVKPEDKTLLETKRFFEGVEGVKSVDFDHIYHTCD